MTRSPARLLVIGGSGFIGGHIVDQAVRRGWDVTNVSHKPESENKMRSPRVRHVTADITKGKALKDALRGFLFEYVVNAGGYIDHRNYFDAGRQIIDAHYGGVLNLAEAINRDELLAFVNIGSSDEYGDNPAPQRETQREAPISPYSAGKLGATQFLQMLNRTENFPAITLRLFLTYGPGQDSRRFLPQIILGCLAGRSFPTSMGEQLRDFCYVQDTVDAVFAAFATPAARGQVINIASGKPVSIRAMIGFVQSHIGGGGPMFGQIAYRPGENMEIYADIAKAKAILNWTPKVTLESGLGRTIQWFRNQQ